MVPFQNYKTMCPYLVGSYEEVADELARYFSAGYRTIILDVPPNPEELHAHLRGLQPRHPTGAVMPAFCTSWVTTQAAVQPECAAVVLGATRLTYGELDSCRISWRDC